MPGHDADAPARAPRRAGRRAPRGLDRRRASSVTRESRPGLPAACWARRSRATSRTSSSRSSSRANGWCPHFADRPGGPARPSRARSWPYSGRSPSLPGGRRHVRHRGRAERASPRSWSCGAPPDHATVRRPARACSATGATRARSWSRPRSPSSRTRSTACWWAAGPASTAAGYYQIARSLWEALSSVIAAPGHAALHAAVEPLRAALRDRRTGRPATSSSARSTSCSS